MANKKYAFILLGALGAIIQFTLLRELTFAVTRHEIAFVIMLSTWLILSGLGSMIRLDEKLLKDHFSVMLTLAFCWGMSACHLLPSWLGVSYYEPASFMISALITLLAIGDSSWLIGAGFRLLCKNSGPDEKPSTFFFWEAVGFCLGGILWTIATVSGINAFWWLGICLFLPFVFCQKQDRIHHASYIILLIACVIVLRPLILSRHIPHETIIDESYGVDGHLMTTQNDDIITQRLNGHIIATNQDTLPSEEFIHTIFSASENPKNILSFDIPKPTDLREIQKYPSARLTVVSDSSQIFKTFFPQAKHDNRMHLVQKSTTEFLKTAAQSYDIILLPNTDIPTIEANRFFTREFFSLCKKHLNPKGIIAFSIESNPNILAPRLKEYDHCLYATLRSVFNNTFFIPGDRMILIASPDGKLSKDKILSRFKKRKINTQLFTEYDLDALLSNFVKENFQKIFTAPAPLNTDLSPEGFLSFTILSNAKFDKETILSKTTFKHNVRLGLAAILLALLIWLCFSPHKTPHQMAPFANGFLSFAATSVLLLLFQIIRGTLFASVGVLCGIFMIGIAAGNTMNTHKRFSLSSLFIFWILWWALIFMTAVYRYTIHFDYSFFILLSFLAGNITGMFYPAILKTRRTLPETLYGWDNLGGFVSGIATTLILIPAFGILNSIMILGGLSVILYILFLRKRPYHTP